MSSPRVCSLVPGLVARIEECWHPSHFREVLKSVRNSFKMVEHMKAVVARLDLVIEISGNFEVIETLIEMREELADEILKLETNQMFQEDKKHFNGHSKQLRILNGGKIPSECERPIVKDEFLAKNADSITKQLTLQVYEDSGRNLIETARRLGVSVGLLANRLRTYGMYP